MSVLSRFRPLVPMALALLGAACTGQPAATSPEAGTPSPAGTPATASATPNTEAAALTVMLTDDECRADGDLELQPGRVVITASNRDSASRGSFQLLRIGEGGTYGDLAAHVAEEQARIDAGEELSHIPDYASEVGGVLIEAGTDETFEATVENGTHAIVCADWADETPETGSDPGAGGRILIIGPLVVH